MFCRLCGKKAAEDAKYCEKCGAKLPESEEAGDAFEKNPEVSNSQFQGDIRNDSLNHYKNETGETKERIGNTREYRKFDEPMSKEGQTETVGRNIEDTRTENYDVNNVPKEPIEFVPDYLVWAILSIFCCCIPFSIIAIVYSSKVSSALSKGDIEDAKIKSEKAKNWTLAAFICGIIYILIVSILLMLNVNV